MAASKLTGPIEWRPTRYPMDEIRDQVVSQCKTVEHLARVLAQLHGDRALIYARPPGSASKDAEETFAFILNMVGDETARIMELLGDILNGLDAVSDEDARFDPVFEKAQELWPIPSTSSPPRSGAAPNKAAPEES